MATYIPNVTDVIPEPSLFTPDFSFIDKMLRRRQGLYEQGFAQVNSAYNFVNRNVTNPYSLNVRDTFLKQAKENLKNLSSLDLSQQQNVNSAKGVFEPFIKNKPVLMDMAATAHWDQQEAIGESYRLKDGGKEFSEDNLNYIRQQRAAFAADDINSVGGYYANRRSYNPYYDYNKEVMEAMKSFKPSSYEYDKIQGLYKRTESDSSWREAEIKEYLDGVLSDKAKQQMKIEASVRLGSNPQALTNAYLQSADNMIKMNQHNIGVIDQKLSGNLKKDEIDLLKQKKQQLEDATREINTNVETIKKGDLSFIKNNSERLAYGLYFNSKLSGFIKAYSHDEIKVKLDGDEVGIALMEERGRNARHASSLAHATKLKLMELNGIPGNFQVRDIAEGSAKGNQVTTQSLQAEYDTLDKDISKLSNAQREHIAMKIKERDPNSKVTAQSLTADQINNWIKTGGPGGKRISDSDPYWTWQSELAQKRSKQARINSTFDKINDGAMAGMSEADKNAVKATNDKLLKIADITLDDGTVISGTKLAAGLKNGTIKKSMSWFSDSGTITIDGKTYTVEDRISGRSATRITSNLNLLSAIKQVESILNQGGAAYKKYSDGVQTYLKNNYADLNLITKVISFDEGSAQNKSLEASGSVYVPNDFTVRAAGVGTTAENQGNAYFYITPKGDTKATPEEILAKMQALGATNARLIKTDKGEPVFEIPNLRNNVVQQFRTFTPSQSDVIAEVSAYSGAKEYISSPFTVENSNTKYLIKKFGGLYYLHINGSGETFPQAFSDPGEAVNTAKQLSRIGMDVLFNEAVGGTPKYSTAGTPDDFLYNPE